jgi:hypothetical protein
MKLRQLLNWRFSLMFFHRWLGIILLLMFLAWTTSGFILMYAGIPHMEAGERLNRLPPLDTSTITITPQQAWQATGRPQQPFRLRLSMRDNRPVYEVNTGFVFGNWTLVYADTGEVKAPLSAEQAMAWMRQTYPEYADSINFETTITGPDMYTHSPGVQTYMPMHRINLGDTADTDYYVSAGSAEVVMKTTRLTRLLGFFGYNIHTLFFFRQAPWQTTLLHWLSWAGLALAVLGVTLGIWRFSLKPLYVQRGTAFRTPIPAGGAGIITPASQAACS